MSQAAVIIASRCRITSTLNYPDAVKSLCINRLAAKEHEVIVVLMLNSQYRLIEFVELFTGTIDAASVYPREVAKAVLRYNAVAVIVCHNHPSGLAEPSQADRHITERVVRAFEVLDVQVLDHIVVGLNETVSFAERGWL